MDHILFMVEQGNAHVFTWALNREDAVRRASSWLGDGTERFVVTPLTKKGDRIHLDITLYA